MASATDEMLARRLSTSAVFLDSFEHVLTRPAVQSSSHKVMRRQKSKSHLLVDLKDECKQGERNVRRISLDVNDLFKSGPVRGLDMGDEEADAASETEYESFPQFKTKLSHSQETLAENVKEHLMDLREGTLHGSIKSYDVHNSTDPYTEKCKKGATSSSTAIGLVSCCVLF